MRKLLALCLILNFCSVFASAQTTNKAVDWKSFSGIDEEFSVEVPKSFKLVGFAKADKNAPKFYKDFSNETYFFITSAKDMRSSRYQQIYNFTVNNKAESSDRFIGKFLGKFFNFIDSEGFYQQIFAIEGKNRFYIFHTVSETENNPMIERFFASIKFDKNPLEQGKIFKVQIEPQQTSNRKYKESEDVIGSEVGSENPNSAISMSKVSAINILSKPKPSYTDLAAKYEISGDVTLKITFLANGSVGAIMPVTKLPFGLTNNAMDAARSLHFEPAMRDGMPITLVKTAIYNFSLY